MENASKALIIAGAILLSILIIAIGMFIFNGAKSTIENSMQSMSTQEVQAFNNEFTGFEGKQTGSNIKALLGTLIANANTYKDEPDKIPAVVFDKVSVGDNASPTSFVAKVPTAGDPTTYINEINKLRNKVEPKHTYWVTIPYQPNGLVDGAIISYDPGDKGEALSAQVKSMHKNGNYDVSKTK